MSELIRVADASAPFDYTVLPDDVKTILGYIGLFGYTPHIWSVPEVQAARKAGLRWFAICTVPLRRLTAADGHTAAGWCLMKLPEYGYTPDMPVFLDIEYGAYQANPAGADACVTAWRDGMRAGGYHAAIPYLPLSAGYGWLAHWTGVAPATLPDGVAGIQYDHALAGDAYDISIFRPDIFPGGTDTMPLDQDALNQIDALFARHLTGLFGRLHGDLAGTEAREVADEADAEQAKVTLSSLQAGLDELRARPGGQLNLDVTSIPCTLTLQPDPGAGQNSPAPAPSGPQPDQPAPDGTGQPTPAP